MRVSSYAFLSAPRQGFGSQYITVAVTSSCPRCSRAAPTRPCQGRGFSSRAWLAIFCCSARLTHLLTCSRNVFHGTPTVLRSAFQWLAVEYDASESTQGVRERNEVGVHARCDISETKAAVALRRLYATTRSTPIASAASTCRWHTWKGAFDKCRTCLQPSGKTVQFEQSDTTTTHVHPIADCFVSCGWHSYSHCGSAQ